MICRWPVVFDLYGSPGPLQVSHEAAQLVSWTAPRGRSKDRRHPTALGHVRRGNTACWPIYCLTKSSPSRAFLLLGLWPVETYAKWKPEKYSYNVVDDSYEFLALYKWLCVNMHTILILTELPPQVSILLWTQGEQGSGNFLRATKWNDIVRRATTFKQDKKNTFQHCFIIPEQKLYAREQLDYNNMESEFKL